MQNQVQYDILGNRSLIGLSGCDTHKFMQSIISNDIYLLDISPAIYALLLSPQGKYLYDFFVAKSNDGLLLDCHSSVKDALIKRLSLYKLQADVNIIDLSTEYKVLHVTDYINASNWCFKDPRHSSMLFRCWIQNDQMQQVEQYKLDNGAYEQFRIYNAIPEGVSDLDLDKSFPLEFGFEKLNAISFTKGCYVGQEVIARTTYRGVVRKQPYKVEAENGTLPAKHAPIIANGNEVGVMCSSLGNIGIALIRVEDYEANSQMPVFAGDIQIKLTPVNWLK
jgi:folate-binding protein YgfZ